jgi:hypothetical protein
MTKALRHLDLSTPRLQHQTWPPVAPFEQLPAAFERFLYLDQAGQDAELAALRARTDDHAAFMHEGLSAIYAYVYGYHDSPLALQVNDARELRLLQAKVRLERELMDHWILPAAEVVPRNQGEAADYLAWFSTRNQAVDHPLFDWLASSATLEELRLFLDGEVVRNEVVDDEVALLLRGHQGQLKNMLGENLFDELGLGKLEHAHTYWLRRYLEQTDGWERIRTYRSTARPWFLNITSNVFNMTLTRPGLKFAAYGHFLITEAFVRPHFDRLLEGMRRVGLAGADVEIYFSAHSKLDPHHAEELIEGVAQQVPALASPALVHLLMGAQWAAAGATEQYRRAFNYFTASQRER